MDFDPRSPAFRSNPYPFYDTLRTHAPIFYWDVWGIWFLTRYEDCNTLLRDNRLGHGGMSEPPFGQDALNRMMSRWMLMRDPPDHTRLRSLVHKAFTPRMVAQLRSTVQEITDGLLDAGERRGQMELIADFAYPLPVTVICAMLGIPQADHPRFHGWSDAIARSLDLTEEEAVYVRASAAAEELTDYLESLLAQRRASPQADLLSALAAAEESGDRLTQDELFATCALLLIAGHETTINLIGNGALALLRHRDQWERLGNEPQLIPSAVEELLRFDSPVQMTSRIVLEEFCYRDVTFRRGQQIAFLLGAANHDPAQFAEPSRLDIGRSDNRHLAFGGGIHYCLGAPLARLEGEIAFHTLSRRMPDLSLATDAISYRDNFVLRGLERLPVLTQ
jgi:cytochrome P450